MEAEVEEVKQLIQNQKKESEKKVKDCIVAENRARLEEWKKQMDEGFMKMKEIMMKEKAEEEQIKTKEIDERFMIIAADLTVAQKTAEELREKVVEDAEKVNRRNNVIVYNVPESISDAYPERLGEDSEFCKGLMKDALKVGCEEGDIKKIFRLGKKIEGSKPRPILIVYNNYHIKNLVMENATKLSRAEGKYAGVTISHDMTVKEREQCRKLVNEAKQKQEEDVSGEYIYKVRGSPGQMKIIRYRKMH